MIAGREGEPACPPSCGIHKIVKTGIIMKKIIVFSVLLVMCAGFSSCKKNSDSEKSKACDIVKFTTGDKVWNIGGTSVTAVFAKGTAVNSLTPVIEVSAGATVDPKSGTAQDFSGDKTVTYTVTAEDGVTKKTYTAQATVSAGN